MILKILDSAIDEWRKCENKLIIWGDKGTACKIGRFLEKNSINFDGFAVNKIYYDRSKSILMEHKIYCLEEYLDNHVCSLIIGFSGFTDDMLEGLNKSNVNRIYAYDFLGMLALDEDNTIDEKYVKDNDTVLKELRDMLEDDKSQSALDEFLNQKLTGAYRKPYSKYAQYFDEEIIKFDNNKETFIDCGAFQGETVESFIDELNKNGIHEWNEIIAVEADPYNVNQMKEKLLHCKNVYIEEAAVLDRSGYVLWADEQGQSSRVSDLGGIKVKTKTIDEIGKGKKVTFIKMDIEGAELQALHGARKVIEENHPKLAVCIYHKPEDIITIPQYIKSISSDYKLYLRNYSEAGVETVLYAI